MGSTNTSVGNRGEKLAENFLKKKKYKILGRGVYTGRAGELDIIARQGQTLVFVEVKSRRSDKFGTPEEAVSFHKQENLKRAIDWYRAKHGLLRMDYRLDVIAIDLSGDEPQIRHHEKVILEV